MKLTVPPVLAHPYILFILKFNHIHVIFPTFFKVRHECISHSIYLLCLITNVVYAIFSLLSRQIAFITSQILLFIPVYIVKLLFFKSFLIFSLFSSSQNLVNYYSFCSLIHKISFPNSSSTINNNHQPCPITIIDSV